MPAQTAARVDRKAARRSSPEGAAERRRDRKLGRIGWACVVLAVLVAMAGVIYLSAAGTFRTAERDDAANQARAAGAPAAALCRSPSSVVPVLRAAGVCQAAEGALASPVVTENTPPLSAAEVSAIVARVLPLTPPGAPLVPALLDQLATDPAAPRLDEATTRAVVAAAVGEQQASPNPGPATQAPDPNAGDQYRDVRFVRNDDGSCRGITTYTRPDGSTREETSDAPDGACGPPDDPPPPASSEPPPPPPPEPSQTGEEPPPPSGTDQPSSTSEEPAQGAPSGILGPS